METITLREVLKEMDKGVPFDISFVTADRKRGTGGEIKSLTKVFLTTKQPGKAEREVQKKLASGSASLTTGIKRSPNHYENSTRNLYDPKKPRRNHKQGERIVKIHLRLILTFNGKTVI